MVVSGYDPPHQPQLLSHDGSRPRDTMELVDRKDVNSMHLCGRWRARGQVPVEHGPRRSIAPDNRNPHEERRRPNGPCPRLEQHADRIEPDDPAHRVANVHTTTAYSPKNYSRLIVGKATGPGTLPFDYFKAMGKSWEPVPPAAQKAFPAIDEIMRRKVVPSPLNFAT